MKKIVLFLTLLLLAGCADKGIYTNEEYEALKNLGLEKQAVSECENPQTVQKMLQGDFKEENLATYCKLKVENTNGLNELIDKNLEVEEIEEYLSYPYMRIENIDRYIKYKSDSIKDKILKVNMDLDYKAFEITKIVKDFDDYTLLVNKYNALPEGYHPDDLIPLEHVCVLGEDYSCPDMTLMIREKVGQAWNEFNDAANKQGLELRAIAGLRTYEYQRNLYNYYANLNGKEYAEKYFARPGQSEHNSGLAIDFTFNGYAYTQIEGKEGYDWILNNMANYGFILRYPKDKTDITLYGYESWHIRYVGKEVAQYIMQNNLTLEEYLAMQ